VGACETLEPTQSSRIKALPFAQVLIWTNMNLVDVTKRWRYLDFVSPNRNPVVDLPVTEGEDWEDNGSVYQLRELMSPFDFLICVEHCCNCIEHQDTTQHEESKYVDSANDVIRYLSESVHDSKLSVRLGVLRHKIAVEKRIGGFEIKILYKGEKGSSSCLLHSKLATRKWPSKSVMDKKLNNFIMELDIPRHDKSHRTFLCSRRDGSSQYPVGFGPWHELAISDLAWQFRGFSIGGRSENTLPESFTSDVIKDSLSGFMSSPIEWIMDTRERNRIKYDAGIIVRVQKVSSAGIPHDRHGLYATTVGYEEKDPEGVNILYVQLKYFERPMMVDETQLIVSEASASPASIPYSAQMPESLMLVLLLSGTHRCKLPTIRDSFEHELIESLNRIQFYEARMDRSDSADIVLYEEIVTSGKYTERMVSRFNEVSERSRQSLFHYLRHTTAHIEHLLDLYGNANTCGDGTPRVKNPFTGRDVDLQLCYSENVLDWIYQHNDFGRSGNIVNMTGLYDAAFASVLRAMLIASPISRVQGGEVYTPRIVVPTGHALFAVDKMPSVGQITVEKILPRIVVGSSHLLFALDKMAPLAISTDEDNIPVDRACLDDDHKVQLEPTVYNSKGAIQQFRERLIQLCVSLAAATPGNDLKASASYDREDLAGFCSRSAVQRPNYPVIATVFQALDGAGKGVLNLEDIECAFEWLQLCPADKEDTKWKLLVTMSKLI
jgi:hypothetical protein